MLKFDAVQFSEGTLTLQITLIAVLVLLVVLAVVWVAFLRSKARLRVRVVSASLRSVAALLLVLPLFEPRLVTPEVIPDENFVAVLVDVSDSMLLTDNALEQSRLDVARTILFDKDRGIWPELEDVFKLRLYTFAGTPVRADSVIAADPGNETNLSAAVERVLQDFRSLPLTGIVLITDGNTTNRTEVMNQAAQVQDRGLGLHVIGVGSSSFAAERELLEVIANKGVGERTGAEIEVKVRSAAREPEPVTFTIYDGDVAVSVNHAD